MRRLLFLFLFITLLYAQRWQPTNSRHVNVRGEYRRRDVFGPTTGNIIKIGRTYAFSGQEVPYSTSQNSYLQMFFNYVNNVTNGIIINGTTYHVQQIVYNDASDCSLVSILYERLATVDQVDAFIGEITDTCEGASLIAEKYNIPMINAGNYQTGFDYPNGVNWTFSINTNPLYLAKGCIDQLAKAGAKTAVIAGTSILQAAFGSSTNYTLGTETTPLKILDYVVLDQASIDSNQTSSDYLTPLIERWNALQPDVFIGGAGDTAGTINLLEAMRENFFNVKAQYHWIGPNIAETRAILGWTGYGVLTGSGFDASSFNFSDSILGNSQVYVRLFRQTFNAEASYFDASNVAAGIVILRAMQNAGTLNKEAVREALLRFNESTILGMYTMAPTGYLENVPNYCFQIFGDGSYHPLYDPNQFNLQNSVTLDYPYDVVYPPGWGYKPSWYTRNKNWLLPVVIIIPIAAIVFLIATYIAYTRYHCIFLPKKGDAPDGDNW